MAFSAPVLNLIGRTALALEAHLLSQFKVRYDEESNRLRWVYGLRFVAGSHLIDILTGRDGTLAERLSDIAKQYPDAPEADADAFAVWFEETFLPRYSRSVRVLAAIMRGEFARTPGTPELGSASASAEVAPEPNRTGKEPGDKDEDENDRDGPDFVR